MPECVVEDEDAAGPQQAFGLGDMLDVLELLGVDQDKIVGRIAEVVHHLEGASSDQPEVL